MGTTTSDIPPTTLPPVTAVDVGQGVYERIGGFNVINGEVSGVSGNLSETAARRIQSRRPTYNPAREARQRLQEQQRLDQQRRDAEIAERARQQRLREIAEAINRQENNQYGSAIDYGKTNLGDNQIIYSEPTIIKRKTGVVEGTNVPTVEFIVVGGSTERKATKEEIKRLEEKEKSLTVESTTALTGIKRKIDTSKLIQDVKVLSDRELISQSFIKDVGDVAGGVLSKQVSYTLGGDVSKTLTGESYIDKKPIAEFISGGVQGFIPSTAGDVALTAVTAGVGAGVGFSLKGASAIVTKVPKVGSYLSSGIKGVGFVGGGLLTAEAVGTTVSSIVATPGAEEKGKIFGETSREFLAFGKGFGFGEKKFVQARGLFETRGLDLLPQERLIPPEVLSGEKSFPLAPKKKQLGLFEGTAEKFPELSEGIPGGFHSSPGKILTKGEVSPLPGTSELPGLFISSFVSKHFLKIGGKGSSSFKLPKVSEIFSPEVSPSISFFKPKKFRISKGVPTEAYEVGGQKFKYKFSDAPKEGYADVPLIKTEIEAILRPDTGIYTKGSKKYYSEIEGVRIPIEVLEFKEGSGITGKVIKESDLYQPTERLSTTSYSSSSGPSSSVTVSNIPSSNLNSVTSNLMGVSSSTPGSSSSSTPSSVISDVSSYKPSSSNRPISKVSSIISPSSTTSSIISPSSSKLSSVTRSYLSSPKSSRRSLTSSYAPSKKTTFGKLPDVKSKKKKKGLFEVSVRRGGKFESKGLFTSSLKAVNVGKGLVSDSLAATYKVTGDKGLKLKTPGGFYSKQTKEGRLFIEKRKYRLSKKGEVKEIQKAKKTKRRSKK
jgi:hypothetical protein